MSRFAKLFAANVIAASGLGAAAVALGSPATAEPIVPPAVPAVPALSMIQDFATNPASMGAVLQTAATALNGASSMIGAPAPNTLPVSPIVGAPATPPVPAPMVAPMGVGSTVVPLLNQIGIPAQLVNLAPQMPFLGNTVGAVPAVAPVAPALTPVTPVAPAVVPVAPAVAPIAPAVAPIAPAPALAPVAPAAPAVVAPAAPAVPTDAVLNPLPLIAALP